jgi:leucine-zipper-like transcriptional regulator 1
VAVFDGKMWVMGGYDGTDNRLDVWYSDDGIGWHQVPDTPWDARHAATVYTYDNALWMMSGYNRWDVWKLVPIRE